jgi:hypothetical protein
MCDMPAARQHVALRALAFSSALSVSVRALLLELGAWRLRGLLRLLAFCCGLCGEPVMDVLMFVDIVDGIERVVS